MFVFQENHKLNDHFSGSVSDSILFHVHMYLPLTHNHTVLTIIALLSALTYGSVKGSCFGLFRSLLNVFDFCIYSFFRLNLSISTKKGRGNTADTGVGIGLNR